MNNASDQPGAVKCPMLKKLTSKEKMDLLRARLLEDARPASTALVERLDRCATDWKGRFECRSPACYHCRRRHVVREQRIIRNWLGHLDNTDLGFVTVVIGATSEVGGIGDLIRQNREHTRKRVAACRAQSGAWDGVCIAGWHEIDAVGEHQLQFLPPKRRPLIEQIAPLSFGSGQPAWITTWHGVIHRNGLAVEDIACEFRRQWKLDGQVDVQGFELTRPVTENLDRVTSYANKFECVTKLKDHFVDEWPASWQVEFFGWLQGVQRNPFEALRFSVNQSVKVSPKVIHPVKNREPLPCLISRVPTYDYTGAWS